MPHELRRSRACLCSMQRGVSLVMKDAEVDLQETVEYQAAKETLQESRVVARR